MAIFFVAGCATVSPEPIDLGSGGWHVRQAQAIWRPGADKPEIAGDLIVADKPDGSAFVQFSKTLPIASALVSSGKWAIEFPPQNRRYSGRGAGPARVVWLQLIHVLQNRSPAKRWSISRPSEGVLVLSDHKSGENLEVHFQ
jgi:hypothetical protein